MDGQNWYEITNAKGTISPSLLVYPDRIEKNIRTMIKIAGGTDNLRPHVKTHKIAEIIKMQLDQGIYKFKCATIAEAELLAQCGAEDILLAIQPVGVNIGRFLELLEQYPQSSFSTIVDNSGTLNEISKLALSKNREIQLWLDMNVGMNRTGIEYGKEAIDLYKMMETDPNIIAKGLHAYDGHIHEPNERLRKNICDEAYSSVIKLKNALEQQEIKIETVVAGGSPSFPIHAKRQNVETSPGTTLLWDARYGELFKDLHFLPAAVLLTRIISKPTTNVLCFDLGHKSVASEMQLPRVKILGLEDCKHVSQSEEHLVVECKDAEKYAVGDVCYAIPFHICPTVAKYPYVLTVKDREITDSWKVAARDHKIII